MQLYWDGWSIWYGSLWATHSAKPHEGVVGPVRDIASSQRKTREDALHGKLVFGSITRGLLLSSSETKRSVLVQEGAERYVLRRSKKKSGFWNFLAVGSERCNLQIYQTNTNKKRKKYIFGFWLFIYYFFC